MAEPSAPSFFSRFKNFKLPVSTFYPIVIILTIPTLLIANTLWNLKSFNRDANFIVRHQAVSIADTLKPLISEKSDNLSDVLSNLVSSNEDILSLTVFRKSGDKLEVASSTLSEADAKTLSGSELNHLAADFSEPFAALSYEPKLGRNIWNVVVPLSSDESEMKLLSFQMDTKSVNEILSRTSRDSILILVILIAATLILLANHFYFYLRALKTKQLEELDRLKDEFISMAAHELRAPITAITGYLELLRDELKSGKADSVHDEISVLTGLTKDLNGLVEDLLDVSRIEQGRIKIEPAETNIIEVLQKVVTVMQPTAAQKGLSLNLVTEEQIPNVSTDPERLRQVATNLVSNSIKYTLKGSVTVNVKMKDKNVEINVRDTGIGIPPEHMEKLFGKFHRVQDKQTREVRGTGLGLWITKQIVELLGGEIHAESIYGTGSSFTFTVPSRS